MCPPGVLRHFTASRRRDLPEQPGGRGTTGEHDLSSLPTNKSLLPSGSPPAPSLAAREKRAVCSTISSLQTPTPPLPSKLQLPTLSQAGHYHFLPFSKTAIFFFFFSTKTKPNARLKPPGRLPALRAAVAPTEAAQSRPAAPSLPAGGDAPRAAGCNLPALPRRPAGPGGGSRSSPGRRPWN